MKGQDIFKQAVTKLSQATNTALKECNLKKDDINWFVPHQANQRIILSTAKKLGINEKKTISTVEYHANTSAASIPLAISSEIKSGKIKKNENHLKVDFPGATTSRNRRDRCSYQTRPVHRNRPD